MAAALLAVLVPFDVEDPERALQSAVADALAADTDDRLLAVALEQYPLSAPPIAIAYGHLPLFREQLARFGPQVVPIVAAYQNALTLADALQIAGQAWDSVGNRLGGDPHAVSLAPLTPEERGLIALLKMREEGNAFVGQWEITAAGEARRIPSRLVTLGGPELLLGGLTALERRIVQERETDWRTYGLAAVDLAAIASGVALLRFARTAGRGVQASRAAGAPVTRRSGALAAAEVLGINAVRYGLPLGLVGLMALHPGVFTHYLWVLAESGPARDPRPADRLGRDRPAALVPAHLAAALRAGAAPDRPAVRRRGAGVPAAGCRPGEPVGSRELVRRRQIGCTRARADPVLSITRHRQTARGAHAPIDA